MWTFGDSSSPVTTTSTPFTTTHVYAAGSYTAGVMVTDAVGRTASATLLVTIVTPPPPPPTPPPSPPPPPGTLAVTISCTTETFFALGNTITCTAVPTLDGFPSSAQVHSYVWDFGDGVSVTSQGQTAAHVFTTVGSRLIEVTATDDAGHIGRATTTITIQ